MYCSKCGNLCDSKGVCTSCGNGQRDIMHSFSGKKFGRSKSSILLIVLLCLQWIFVFSPIVKVESELLNVAKQFGLFDFSKNNLGKIIVGAIHFVAIGCLIVSGVEKVRGRELYVLPSVAASVVSLCLVVRVIIKKNELISTLYVKELLNLVNVDFELTAYAIFAILSSVVILAVSVYKLYATCNTVGNNSERNTKKTVSVKEALQIPKKDLKEFIVALAALCVVTGILLAIPTVLQNIFSKSILGEWYSVDEETGRTRYVVFHQDNTCEIDNSTIPINWETENGKIILREMYGQEYAYNYEWEGNDLVINGIVFTRNP